MNMKSIRSGNVFEVLTIVSGEADTIFGASRFWTKRQRQLATAAFSIIYHEMLADVIALGRTRGTYTVVQKGCYVEAYGWRCRDHVALFVTDLSFDGGPGPHGCGPGHDLKEGAVTIATQALLIRMGRTTTYHQTRGKPINRPPTQWRRKHIIIDEPASRAMLLEALARAPKPKQENHPVKIDPDIASSPGKTNIAHLPPSTGDIAKSTDTLAYSAVMTEIMPAIRVAHPFDPKTLAFHTGVQRFPMELLASETCEPASFGPPSRFNNTVLTPLSSSPSTFGALEIGKEI